MVILVQSLLFGVSSTKDIEWAVFYSFFQSWLYIIADLYFLDIQMVDLYLLPFVVFLNRGTAAYLLARPTLPAVMVQVIPSTPQDGITYIRYRDRCTHPISRYVRKTASTKGIKGLAIKFGHCIQL